MAQDRGARTASLPEKRRTCAERSRHVSQTPGATSSTPSASRPLQSGAALPGAMQVTCTVVPGTPTRASRDVVCHMQDASATAICVGLSTVAPFKGSLWCSSDALSQSIGMCPTTYAWARQTQAHDQLVVVVSGSPRRHQRDSAPHLVAVACGGMSGMYDLRQGSIAVQSADYAQVHFQGSVHNYYLQYLLMAVSLHPARRQGCLLMGSLAISQKEGVLELGCAPEQARARASACWSLHPAEMTDNQCTCLK